MKNSIKIIMGKASAMGCTLLLVGLMFSACSSVRGIVGSDENISSQAQPKVKDKKSKKIPDFVFTYAENQTSDYPTTQAARYFAELVNEGTEGRIEIRIYPNAELGDEVSAMEQMKFGGIDFGRGSLSSLAGYSPESVVLQMPYLYNNSEHMWQVLDGDIGDGIKASFQGSGLKALAWFDAGVRNFYTIDRPIRSIEDMEGLEIRVQKSELAEDMVKALGAKPVPIDYEDVTGALQTKEVDGAENNWSSYEAMGHNVYAKYYSLDEHMRIPELMLMSEVTWNKLSKEDQEIISECALKAGNYERMLWNNREESSRQKCIASGTEEIKVTDREKDRFRAKMNELYEKYCGDYMEIIHKIAIAASLA